MQNRMLVVDDDPLMRRLMTVLLEDIGDATEAGDGAEALDKLRTHKFDLILLDWDMPGISGLEVLKAARAAGIRIPIIMVTGIAEKEQILKAIHAGVSDYVVKPLDGYTLRKKVEKWCPSMPGEIVSGQGER